MLEATGDGKPTYIGLAKQLPLEKNPLLPAGKALTPAEVLSRRSEEADTTAFFNGGKVADRPLVKDETVALEEVVKKAVKGEKAKVIPFNFSGNADDSESGEDSNS
jgi:hypothetical protein